MMAEPSFSCIQANTASVVVQAMAAEDNGDDKPKATRDPQMIQFIRDDWVTKQMRMRTHAFTETVNLRYVHDCHVFAYAFAPQMPCLIQHAFSSISLRPRSVVPSPALSFDPGENPFCP